MLSTLTYRKMLLQETQVGVESLQSDRSHLSDKGWYVRDSLVQIADRQHPTVPVECHLQHRGMVVVSTVSFIHRLLTPFPLLTAEPK